jgi:dihydroorotase-like cyclic amidohydrolase
MADTPYIIIFPSTYEALNAERAAKEAGIPVTMTVVPRHLSSDCNMGMTGAARDRERLETLLRSSKVECTFVDTEC